MRLRGDAASDAVRLEWANELRLAGEAEDCCPSSFPALGRRRAPPRDNSDILHLLAEFFKLKAGS